MEHLNPGEHRGATEGQARAGCSDLSGIFGSPKLCLDDLGLYSKGKLPLPFLTSPIQIHTNCFTLPVTFTERNIPLGGIVDVCPHCRQCFSVSRNNCDLRLL